MLQLDQTLRTSNGLNLRIWLNSSRICLLKHPVPQISFSIILNSPQTSQLDQDLTEYLTDYEATREAMLLQAPITGRKISAELTKRCRGESSNTPRHVSS